jgi:hypothetical protein
MKLKIDHNTKEKLELDYYNWLIIRDGSFRRIDCPYNFLTFLETKKIKFDQSKDK